jgi:hypothetical protein
VRAQFAVNFLCAGHEFFVVIERDNAHLIRREPDVR